MQCGRQSGGERVDELGVCPAAAQQQFDGINHGDAAGRLCWAVAGTLCGGQVRGTFAKKLLDCAQCEFYQAVEREEGNSFALVSPLATRILRWSGRGCVRVADLARERVRYIPRGEFTETDSGEFGQTDRERAGAAPNSHERQVNFPCCEQQRDGRERGSTFLTSLARNWDTDCKRCILTQPPSCVTNVDCP